LIDAGGAPADYSTDTLASHASQPVWRFACWAEALSLRLPRLIALAHQPAPPTPRITTPARASADFTAQVMARLATPPPEPDPRETKSRQAHARMRRLAGIYLTLVLASGVALLALATVAPWAVMGLAATGVSAALVAMTFASLVSQLTDGLVSGFGVAYLAMLAALAPPLLLLARRAGRSPSRRR
jgi:hypothetical protein